VKALNKQMPVERKKEDTNPEIKEAEKSLTAALGTRVQISGDMKKGKIILQYYNQDQLNALYDFLMTNK
jgi:ParB family chromosome partitioning protein